MAEDEQEYYGYYYGEEDKGLLDPAWEKQQKKVRDFDWNFVQGAETWGYFPWGV